jgi:hypothetical protein
MMRSRCTWRPQLEEGHCKASLPSPNHSPAPQGLDPSGESSISVLRVPNSFAIAVEQNRE